MRTTIKAWMSSNLGRIPPLTLKLAALERLKNLTISLLVPSSFIFDWILFILAGKKGNYKSLDEFEFRQNFAADFGVSFPLASDKTTYNLVSTLAPSFLIGSTSYLQVTRPTVISRTSLNFGQIRPRTSELAALEHQEKFP